MVQIGEGGDQMFQWELIFLVPLIQGERLLGGGYQLLRDRSRQRKCKCVFLFATTKT